MGRTPTLSPDDQKIAKALWIATKNGEAKASLVEHAKKIIEHFGSDEYAEPNVSQVAIHLMDGGKYVYTEGGRGQGDDGQGDNNQGGQE